MTDLTEVRNFNGFPQTAFKSELKQFYGIIFAVLSSFFYSLCSVIVKFLAEVSFMELSLFRFLGVLLPAISYVVYRNENVFPEGKRKLLVLRCIVGSLGLIFSFYAFQNMQLGDSTVIIFSTPVFVAIFSRIFLGEKCGLFNIFTIFLTLLGIVFIVKPPSLFDAEEEVTETKSSPFLGPLAALASCVFTSSAMILIRVLKDLHHSVVICNFGIFACAFTFCLLMATGRFCLPSCPNRFLVLLLATFSFLGQILLTISLKIEEASVVSIARSTTIVFAFIWQIIFFHEIPCFSSIFGAILIIGSVGLNALKKYALLKDSNVSKNLARLLKL